MDSSQLGVLGSGLPFGRHLLEHVHRSVRGREGFSLGGTVKLLHQLPALGSQLKEIRATIVTCRNNLSLRDEDQTGQRQGSGLDDGKIVLRGRSNA